MGASLLALAKSIYYVCHHHYYSFCVVFIFLPCFSTWGNEWKKKKISKNKHSETGTKDHFRIFAIVVKYHDDHEDNHEDNPDLSLVL